jgi:hypothetical protein
MLETALESMERRLHHAETSKAYLLESTPHDTLSQSSSTLILFLHPPHHPPSPPLLSLYLTKQVTSPQLSMLETALESMERVDAFIMLRNHRSPGNVFEEAHRCADARLTCMHC